MKQYTVVSEFDGLQLSAAKCLPEQPEPKGIIQFTHGMAEHKERYFHVMEHFSKHGYVCVIHDHRGHGGSVRSQEDLGYFYTRKIDGVTEDLRQMICLSKEQYPNLPIYLYSHSMGSLVARCFMKKQDDLVDKWVISGGTTKRSGVGLGLILCEMLTGLTGEKARSRLLNHLAVGVYDKGFHRPNAWLCTVDDVVDCYNSSPLCGFIFTNNGFYNLLSLQKEAFSKDGWQVKCPKLPILMIGGEYDPVIGSPEKYSALKEFLTEAGYQNIALRMYPRMRHEIHNEPIKETVFADVQAFLEQ